MAAREIQLPVDHDDIDAVVGWLLSKATDGVPDPEARYRVAGIETYRDADVRWVWPSYIRRGHLGLIDGRQGGSKTSFILAASSMLSRGLDPVTLQSVPPVRTLYIGAEDEPAELRIRWREFGSGPDGMFLPVKDVWEMDAEGIHRLENLVAVNRPDWVVVDPLLSYAPQGLRQIDNVAITRWMSDLREIAARHDCAIVGVRHFTKYWSRDEAIDNLGAGGNAWASSARFQLVLLPHPDRKRPRFAGVFPARGSLLAPKGDPFGFEVWNGEPTWIKPAAFPLEQYADEYEDVARQFGMKTRKEREQEERLGRAASPKRDAAANAIAAYLTEHEEAAAADVMEHVMRETGCSRRTYFAAKATLDIYERRGMMRLGEKEW